MPSVELNKRELSYQVPREIQIPGHGNAGGSVHFWENDQLFPKGVSRCFWISGVKEGETRGNHAHWHESQVLVAIAGKLEINVSGIDGNTKTFILTTPGVGLFVPPLNWVEIRFSADAVLLGLGDHVFSEADYIRDKNYFGTLR